jgi:hypothetical protein
VVAADGGNARPARRAFVWLARLSRCAPPCSREHMSFGNANFDLKLLQKRH